MKNLNGPKNRLFIYLFLFCLMLGVKCTYLGKHIIFFLSLFFPWICYDQNHIHILIQHS